ncbi:unnamed protein product [Gulo gulo]|uniref:Ig-like domain-containing protein n=1 Tax=Gulo gulo TaxID=48420 RepID=A0A9X9PYJ7_GULGU|nr:unnamed protein product [Gulo gulo]
MEMLLLLPLLGAGSRGDQGYELQVQGAVTVQEGLCVHVPCSFSYPGLGVNNATHVYGSWYRLKDNPRAAAPMATKSPVRGTKRKGLHLSGDPGAGDCSLSITDAQRRHSGNYYFHLYRGLMRHRYRSNRLTVRVTALTQTPDIRVKEPLESGRPSHLTCSVSGACDGATPLTISWTGAALRAPGLDLEASNSSEILLIPHPQDHGTNLTCRVTFPRTGVSTQSTITLNVSCACRAWTWVPAGWVGKAQRGCREDTGLVYVSSHSCVSWGWMAGEGPVLTPFVTVSLCPRRPTEPEHRHLPRKLHRWVSRAPSLRLDGNTSP